MSTNKKITVCEDVTLISLNDTPADIGLISKIFKMIAESEIDVDMISQFPPNGAHSGLSFTVSDGDFAKILAITAKLRDLNTGMKFNVSSGNCKISVFDLQMKGTPGVAAKVFEAAASVNSDIRMITTSETDISLLVVKADLENTVSAIEKAI